MRRSDRWLGFVFLAPAGLILLVFALYPLASVFQMSLVRNWGMFNARPAGLANYRAVLGGGAFWRSFLVTVDFVLCTVPVTLAIAFVTANLLFRAVRGRGLCRALYFLPYITSSVAAAAVWRWLFHIDSRGVANRLLAWIGVGPLRWAEESRGVFAMIADGAGVTLPAWAGGPSLALVSVAVFSIWHTVGFDIVILLAGLTAIPRELREAAAVDGAGPWQRLRHVTLPLLSPTLFFLLLISVIRSFQVFNQFYIMAPAQCFDSARNVTLHIFENFYVHPDYGYAAAVAVVLFVMILVLTLLQTRLLERRVHYE
jgi:multiple sugar transport system permease protein